MVEGLDDPAMAPGVSPDGVDAGELLATGVENLARFELIHDPREDVVGWLFDGRGQHGKSPFTLT